MNLGTIFSTILEPWWMQWSCMGRTLLLGKKTGANAIPLNRKKLHYIGKKQKYTWSSHELHFTYNLCKGISLVFLIDCVTPGVWSGTYKKCCYIGNNMPALHNIVSLILRSSSIQTNGKIPFTWMQINRCSLSPIMSSSFVSWGVINKGSSTQRFLTFFQEPI